MKDEIALNNAKWLIEPGCVILVSSGNMYKPNVMTFSWQTPVNTKDPCLVLLVIHHARYSYELIRQNGELVINIPGEELLEQTHFAGSVSGRNIDKFKESGLTPVTAKTVEPPLINECAGHMECKVINKFPMETHDLLICEVIRALADSELFDGKWIPEKFSTLHYLSGTYYGVLGQTIQTKSKE